MQPKDGAHGLPSPPPVTNPDTVRFWRHTTQSRLVLDGCESCGALVFYPRPFCPACGGGTLVERRMSGLGTVYTHTTVGRGAGPYSGVGAYVLAYVELEEGPRLMTNLAGVACDDVRVGMAVEVVFTPASDHASLPRFRPVPPRGQG